MTTRDLRGAVSVEGKAKQEVAQHFIANVTASKIKMTPWPSVKEVTLATGVQGMQKEYNTG